MAKDKVEVVEVEEVAVEEVEIDAPVAVVEAPVEEVESKSKAEMKRIIEAYKLSNPAKYELKKEELAKKLAAL